MIVWAIYKCIQPPTDGFFRATGDQYCIDRSAGTGVGVASDTAVQLAAIEVDSSREFSGGRSLTAGLFSAAGSLAPAASAFSRATMAGTIGRQLGENLTLDVLGAEAIELIGAGAKSYLSENASLLDGSATNVFDHSPTFSLPYYSPGEQSLINAGLRGNVWVNPDG